MSFGPVVRRLLIVAAAFAAAGVAGLLLWLLPRWQTAPTQSLMTAKDLLLVQNELRQTLVLLLIGSAIVAALAELVRRTAARERAARAALEVTREGQRGDRFADTVALLTDHRVPVRIGAVYALEQLAAESSTQHWPIMEVLCAFLREQTAWEPDRPAPAAVPLDIQAALSVLGRRNSTAEGDQRLDLRRTDLRGADLNGANFTRANLREAHLEGASLQGARLDRADLQGAHLSSADLVEANLEGADLREAHLESAYLVEAHLEGADLGSAFLGGAYLGGAHLEGADLAGADLEGAYLYQAHLDGAFLQGAQAMGAIGIHHDDRDPIQRASDAGDEGAPLPGRQIPSSAPTPISLRGRRLAAKRFPSKPEPKRQETKKT